MSFAKAAQLQPVSEQQQRVLGVYAAALLRYKKACSVHKKACQRLKHKTDTASKYALYEARDVFSQECKLYTAAREEYANAIAVQKLAERGVNVSALQLAQIAGIEIPLSMSEIIALERKQSLIASITPQEREMMLKFTREREEQQRDKERFVKKEKFDPTLDDFEPLPE